MNEHPYDKLFDHKHFQKILINILQKENPEKKGCHKVHSVLQKNCKKFCLRTHFKWLKYMYMQNVYDKVAFLRSV